MFFILVTIKKIIFNSNLIAGSWKRIPFLRRLKLVEIKLVEHAMKVRHAMSANSGGITQSPNF
jgi:hypothetical protein